MNDQPTEPKFNQQARTLAKWLLIIMSLLLLGLIVYWAFWPYRAPEGTGFVFYDPDVERLLPRTLWDWMGLLIIPGVLALGALWFNKTQKDTELKIAEKSRAGDREIAEKAQTVDRDIATARQRQATLEAYYDRMTELMLTHKLRGTTQDAEKQSIARARTVAVVRSLDAERNRQLFAFLKSSNLIASTNSVIDLSGVDLNGANLDGADLSRVSLGRANLSGASLAGADLGGARLGGVNLSGTNLSQANLSGAMLSEANLRKANLYSAYLSGADLSGADLYEANLGRAFLGGADMSWAQVIQAHLRGADMQEANLRGADLSRTNLRRADLSRVDLYKADLKEADLYGTNLNRAKRWSFAQLQQTANLGATTMPDGIRLKGPGNESGLTYDEWTAQYLGSVPHIVSEQDNIGGISREI